MTREDLAFYALSAAAAVSAAVLCWVRRRHGPVAALLAFGFGTDMVQRFLAAELRGQPRPFTGTARLMWTMKEALFTAYVPAVVAAALVVLSRAPRRALLLPAAAWAAIVAAHVFGYPALRQAELGVFYRNVQIAAVIALGTMAIRFELWRRRERCTPYAAEMILLWSIAAEAINLLGPFLFEPWNRWGLARVAYGAVYVVAVITQIIEGASSWKSGQRTRPSC